MTVLFDSSAWLEYFFGSEKGAKIRQLIEKENEAIITTKINIFEIYHKMLKEKGKEDAERCTSFVILKSHVDELSTETIKLATEEKIKRKIGMADAIIIATAIKYDARVYTTDNDFEKVKKIIEVIFL
jgi:toxin FitB